MNFSEIPEYKPEMYEPDFSVVRPYGKNRFCGHTMRRRTIGYTSNNPIIEVKRQIDSDMIPVTSIDLTMGHIMYHHSKYEITLSKRNRFNTILDDILDDATAITYKYDKQDNNVIMIAELSIIDYIRNRIPKPDTHTYYQNNSKKVYKAYEDDEDDEIKKREKFIFIGGNRYSCSKYYTKDLRHLIIPSEYKIFGSPNINNDETFLRISKTNINKKMLTFSFDNDKTIKSLIVMPARLLFSKLHTDTYRCHSDCSKLNHHISYLSNNPGFIKRFEVYYRSDLTKGKWIKIDTYHGNQNMFDTTRIDFDGEITTKEIRIIPLSYENSFDKIRVYPICKTDIKPIDSSSSVTYTIMIPRDGKSIKKYDFTRCINTKYNNHCDCSMCVNRKSNKGQYKSKCETMREACSMRYDDYDM
jgi:hypothetical protein